MQIKKTDRHECIEVAIKIDLIRRRLIRRSIFFGHELFGHWLVALVDDLIL